MNGDAVVVIIGIIVLAVLGLLLGSFANVVIARVPEGRSVVTPRSACPRCGALITARDNIPVVSYLLLRGRCRTCTHPISARYPLVEIITAALFGLWGGWAVVTDQIGVLPLLLVWSVVGVALTAIDLDHHRLPNALTLPMLIVTPIGLLIARLIDGAGSGDGLGVGLGAVIWVGVLGLLWLITGGRGMGLGDVKLAPSLGATLGWWGVGVAGIGLLAAFLLGALVAVVLLLARRVGRRSAVPFGPFLFAGAALAVLVGEPLAQAYAGLLTVGR